MQFFIMPSKLKMTLTFSVICKGNLFVKVSNLQYHALYFLTWGCWKPCLPSVCLPKWVINESLMNWLKCKIGLALILKCFWWIFTPREEKFHFNKKNFIWSKLIKTTLNILESICGCFNFFYCKNPRDTPLVYWF